MDSDQEKIAVQIDAYLQNAMSSEERQAFEAVLQEHPKMAADVKLQLRINESLQRCFTPTERSAADIEAWLLNSSSEAVLAQPPPWKPSSLETRAKEKAPSSGHTHWLNRRLMAIGMAAVVAWMAVGWYLVRSERDVEPYFEARPLVELYRIAVSEGFKPYYDCHDIDRFASTLHQRQGQALRLATMPSGAGMLGLSYPGGLSRNTTAILFRIDGHPVMVFVDQADVSQPTALTDGDAKLHSFRTERDNLVLYEVTPLDAPRALPFLVP